MKHIWLDLIVIAILASLAFGQADSCNMSLVSNWGDIYSASLSNEMCGIAIKDSILYYAFTDALYLFSVSESGVLALIDSLPVSEPMDVQVFDDYLFAQVGMIYRNTNIYDISTPALPILIKSIPFSFSRPIHQEDTIFF